MMPPDRAEERAVRATQEVAARAIRRLEVVGWLILLMAAVLSTAAGAGVAWLIAPPLGLPFRRTWMVTAFLLFVVPAAVSFGRSRAGERRRRNTPLSTTDASDG